MQIPSLQQQAALYRSLFEFDSAERCARQVLDLAVRIWGEDHMETAQAQLSLADLYLAMSRFEEAGVLHQQALDIRRAVLGRHHPLVAESLSRLAGVRLLAALRRSQDNPEEAETILRRALAILNRPGGEAHPVLLPTMLQLADLLRSRQNYTPLRRSIARRSTSSRRVPARRKETKRPGRCSCASWP
jgi:tetratricopeptide (TPR) repeat protein